MPLGSGLAVGLDVGTSAVRAALVSGGRGGYSLLRFGQVALAPGAVVDGEIRDEGTVAHSLAQLWKRARFKTKRAVIGVSNQRVVVRQIEIPFLEEKELRESIKFQVADQIPMPVDDAEIDFQIIDDYQTEGGEHMLRLLLVAAATDMVESFLSAASSAGLQPIGVDLSAFGVARSVSAAARGETGIAGAEAIVDVGAGTSNIVVHRNGEPQFVRILLTGGDAATRAIADELDVSFDQAEATKLDLGRGVGSAEARRILDKQVASLVREIEGSLDYYASQEDSEPIASLVVTGGGSLAPGFFERLQETSGVRVARAAPFAEVATSKSGLTEEQLAQVEQVAPAAVGLSMGVVAR